MKWASDGLDLEILVASRQEVGVHTVAYLKLLLPWVDPEFIHLLHPNLKILPTSKIGKTKMVTPPTLP